MAMDIAIVRDLYSRSFFSFNSSANVIEDNKDFSIEFNKTKDRTNSVVIGKLENEIIDSRYLNTHKSINNGIVPYTVNVYGNDIKPVDLNYTRFTGVISKNRDTASELVTPLQKVFVSRLQPTNIYYKEANAIVTDITTRQNKISLAGTTVQVRSKAAIVIPESSGYGNISLTVQKDCFIELQLPDNVLDVLKLPDELQYSNKFIKGTFTKSGTYTIVAEYADGEQLINITVPYYQRLL